MATRASTGVGGQEIRSRAEPGSSQGGPGSRHLRGNLVGLDLEALRADPARLDELPVEDLPALLERCAVEHGRDHGEALGLAVQLDGVVRYDPAAIDRLRRIRRDHPPRD